MKNGKQTYYNPIKSLQDNEKIQMLTIYQKEWEITIQTQMHFNDLIIKFRSIILSVFIALIGGIFALSKQFNFCFSQFSMLLLLPLIFWITAFIIDFFYYHKMLLGSVEQAKKFDDNEIFKNIGLFGLTECISNRIKPPIASLFIIIYYILPLLLVLLLIIYILKPMFN